MVVGVGLGVGFGVGMGVGDDGTAIAVGVEVSFGVSVDAAIGVAVGSGCVQAVNNTAPKAAAINQDKSFIMVPIIAGISLSRLEHRSGLVINYSVIYLSGCGNPFNLTGKLARKDLYLDPVVSNHLDQEDSKCILLDIHRYYRKVPNRPTADGIAPSSYGITGRSSA